MHFCTLACTTIKILVLVQSTVQVIDVQVINFTLYSICIGSMYDEIY